MPLFNSFPGDTPLCSVANTNITTATSMDSSQSWLDFSLFNQHNPSEDSSRLCLFEAFNNTRQTNLHSAGGDDTRLENDGSRAANLSILTAGPKLEDFLGGCGGGAAGADGCQASLGQFSGENHVAMAETTGVYDSELKTIAASFLCGYSMEQKDTEKPAKNSCL